MPLVHPVIVVPGITASNLRDEYPASPESVWTAVMNKDYERIALHPDSVFADKEPIAYEAIEPARVRSDGVFTIAYKELIEELRFNLREAEDRPVPVYPFAYDWRQPLEYTMWQLYDFIREVIARTLLMRHYHQDADYAAHPKVTLVGHSMGGLIITGLLDALGPLLKKKVGEELPISKVVTLATPFQGSFEAVIKVATGTANLGTEPPSSREREAARLTPALYYLLPGNIGGLRINDKPVDTKDYPLFQRANWQQSVIDTIAEFIRLRGLDPEKDRKARAEVLFSKMLQRAADFRRRVDAFSLANVGLRTEDWLCVVGVDAETRVALNIRATGAERGFVFSSDDRANKWEEKFTVDRRLTGDGTVPFNGALPPFLPVESVVCVTPDDFGYWELQDRSLTKLSGFHGMLPNMDMVQRLVVHFLAGRPGRGGNTWGRRPPGVDHWNPPIPKLRDKGRN